VSAIASPSLSPRSRAAVLVLLAVAGGAVLYVLRPGAMTDDTYAFLDWGRDLRHGMVPSIEGRTFHPVPVLYGAAVSVLGAAAPTVTVILSLAALLLLAAAAWRVVALLTFPQPAPALAALLVMISPMLPVLALAAYVNLLFATLVLWAVAYDLSGRTRTAWALLLVGGLCRPEGWAYVVAYAALTWWRRGRPRARREWLWLVGLAGAAPLLWITIEWVAFGSPAYSFTHTAKLSWTSAGAAGSSAPEQIWEDLRDGVTWPVLVAALAGLVTVARALPWRRSAGFLTLAATAPATIVILAAAGFNLPSRHVSVVASMAIVLAAVGVTAPLRRGGGSVAAAAGAALLVGLTLTISAGRLHDAARTVRASHISGRRLDAMLAARRPELGALALRRHMVAVIGAIAQSELAWSLHVPYYVVTGQLMPETQMLVQPSPAAWSWLAALGLTDRPRANPPRSWRRITGDGWEIYVAPGLERSATGPRLSSSGRQRTLGSIARVITRSRWRSISFRSECRSSSPSRCGSSPSASRPLLVAR
jgi:hypothetical protein